MLKAAAQMAVGPDSDRCRVVLLAREQGPWFEMLPRSDTVLREVMPAEARRLDPLAPESGEARAATFRRMMEAFAIARSVPLPAAQPRINLDEDELGQALVLAMAALEATRIGGQEETLRIDTLLDATLEHEEQFWIRRLEKVGVAEVGSRHLRAVEAAAAALTLLGPSRQTPTRRLALGAFSSCPSSRPT